MVLSQLSNLISFLWSKWVPVTLIWCVSSVVCCGTPQHWFICYVSYFMCRLVILGIDVFWINWCLQLSKFTFHCKPDFSLQAHGIRKLVKALGCSSNMIMQLHNTAITPTLLHSSYVYTLIISHFSYRKPFAPIHIIINKTHVLINITTLQNNFVAQPLSNWRN